MLGPVVTALLTSASLAAPPEGSADGGAKRGVHTAFSDDFEVRYYVVDDRLPDPSDVAVFNYVEQVNRINAHASTERLTLELQVDQVALFANQYYLNDQLRAERQLVSGEVFAPLPGFSYANPEKVRLRYAGEGYTLQLGDSYAAFGRGIALNLNRNVDIDVDTSIQGGKLVARPGAWDLTLVAGQLNRQQVFQDNPNLDIPPDLRHTVVGARAERFGLGPANLGAHGVIYDFVREAGFGPAFDEVGSTPDAVIGGATAELVGIAGIDWYGEGDVFWYPTDELPTTLPGAEDQLGYAAYLSAAFYPGRTIWLVEAKRYYQAQRVNGRLAQELYQVAVAPTLEYERGITEDSAATVNSNDLWGGRVQVDLATEPGRPSPNVSLAVYRDEELGGLHFNRTPETIVHGMIGLEWITDESAALVNAGYRVDTRDDPTEGADRQLHGDAAVKFPMMLGLHGEVQLSAEHFRWGNNAFQQTDYVEVESGLTVQYGSAVALTWYTDYTRNPLVNTTGNLSEPLYGALELQVKPSTAVTLKAFYGAYKAGIRCSGGQCRQLPGFEGGRVSVVASF